MRVSVFCSASPDIPEIYFKEARILAIELVKRNIDIVYGGGAIGLMGILADTVIKHGGNIQGIIAQFMYDLGWAHPGVTDLIIADNMSDRKTKYLVDIDAVIALPGGTGTLEEILDVISLKCLGLFSKPLIILNSNGYYDPLNEMLEKGMIEKFIAYDQSVNWTFAESPLEIIQHLGIRI
ncbi:MAG: TIGR00730 family Rossman fold protein [Bacteroidia bacterium]|nr:TIGR00730 family Rossman fold protein [Bacteroidia bacterium]